MGGRHAPQVVLRNARRHEGKLRRIDPGLRQARKQRDVPGAVDGIEDAVGPALADPGYERGEVFAVEGNIFLADDFDAGAGEPLPHDEVRRPRVDIVGAEEKKLLPLPAGGAPQPVERREDLLVGHLPAIDHVSRRLVSLVLHRIEKQAVALLDDRKHRLATGARPATEQCHRPVIEEGGGPFGEQVGARTGIGGPRIDAVPQHATGRVETLDGVELHVAQRRRADRQRAGLRMEQPDPHRRCPRRDAERTADKQRRRQHPRGGKRGSNAGPERFTPGDGAAIEGKGVGGDRHVSPRASAGRAIQKPPPKHSPRRGRADSCRRSDTSSCRDRRPGSRRERAG